MINENSWQIAVHDVSGGYALVSFSKGGLTEWSRLHIDRRTFVDGGRPFEVSAWCINYLIAEAKSR